MAECLRTWVRFPPSPPIQKVNRFSVGLFYWMDLARMRIRVLGSTNLSGTNLNVRFMHGPEGVSLMDETNIPTISTKQRNHPCGGFFVCEDGVEESPPGFT